MKEPLVSIIMPTYNHGKYIRDAVESVLAQSYTNWELIIINNYSTDNTEEVLAQYKDSRIKVENFNNGGVIARARNRGISESKGEYIAFLDSDDIWLQEKLKIQINSLINFPELLACSTAIRIFPGEIRSPFLKRHTHIISRRSLLKKNYIFNSTVVMRSVCTKEIGFLNEDEELRTIEDYDYWLSILEKRERSFLFINRDLVRYRVSDQNASGIGKSIDKGKEWRKYNAIIINHAKNEAEKNKLIKIKKSELARRLIEPELVSGDKNYDKNEYADLLLLDRVKMVASIIIKHRKIIRP